MRLLPLLALLAALAPLTAHAGEVLERVRRNDVVRCAAPPDAPGFNVTEQRNAPRGLDVDICRAVAAAVLGDGDKMVFVSLPPTQRAEALASGAADLLARDAPASLTRSFSPASVQVGTSFHTGLGFMVRTATNIRSAESFDGAIVCIRRDADVLRSFNALMNARSFRTEIVEFDSMAEALRAFFTNRCDVIIGQQLDLAAARAKTDFPAYFRLTSTYMTMDAWGPVVARGDAQWEAIVRWTMHALVAAEVLGVSQLNISETVTSRDRAVRRLLGAEGNLGERLGLPADWVVRVIQAVGNYGEIYERYFGNSQPMAIERGPNDLWFRGGMMTAPQFQ